MSTQRTSQRLRGRVDHHDTNRSLFYQNSSAAHDNRRQCDGELIEYHESIEKVRKALRDDPLYVPAKHDGLWTQRFVRKSFKKALLLHHSNETAAERFHHCTPILADGGYDRVFENKTNDLDHAAIEVVKSLEFGDAETSNVADLWAVSLVV